MLATTESDLAADTDEIIRPVMPELDTIRGIAVLLVLFFHGFANAYGLAGLSGIRKLFVEATMPGWAGVDLFFVLSGFLITGILLDTRTRPDYYERFYIRRALRILPLYYAILILLLVLARTGLVNRPVSWAFLTLSFFYLANVTRLFGVPMQYGVLWSLAVEEQFYLLWPAALHRLSRRGVVVLATIICVACAALRLFYRIRGYNLGSGYTWLVADGLAMGAALAAISRGPHATRDRMRRLAFLALFASVGAFTLGAPLGIFLESKYMGAVFRETTLDLFFVGTIVSTLLIGTSSWKAVVRRPLLSFFGKISYCVYLIHMLMFEVVNGFFGRYVPGLPPAEGRLGSMAIRFCAGATLTVLLASLSRRYFEEPFLRLKGRMEK